MGDLREYRVILGGTETTMLLTDAHAKRLGGIPVDAPVLVDVELPDPVPVTVKARRAANKAHTTRDKSRG